MRQKRFYIESYGCSASAADAEMISGLLNANSFTPIKTPDAADINIIVTCTVKTTTFNRMAHRIRTLSTVGCPLIVAGCMPRTARHHIEAINPNASLLGPAELDRTLEIVTDALRGIRRTNIDGPSKPTLLLPRIRHNPIIGIVEISSGCTGTCTFCQVRLAKGHLTSYPPKDIVLEVKRALQDGCCEIWLTSQDSGCYGLDIGTDILSLLGKILLVQGDFKIRIGMMNPHFIAPILDDLIKLYRDNHLFRFLHMPVQSGSDRVLRSMRRNHTASDFMETSAQFRTAFPQSTVSTDIIIGYPTETETDFHQTLNLIRNAKPDIVNISRFASRPGTEAEGLKSLDPKLIKERSGALHQLVRKVALQNNQNWVGWKGKIRVDEVVKGAVVGRNQAYRPILIRDTIPLGHVLDIQVVRATSACLVGEIV
jgi:threonylcarbamoyladenosine tRNA methylthiotransferase CDKAL1